LHNLAPGFVYSYNMIVFVYYLHFVLDSGFWILDTGYWLLDTGYWILVTGYWLLGTGLLIRVALLFTHTLNSEL
jgi:hypothetical protein